jgi:peptidyl-prolyl isomerase H (cyclophilin H)
MKRARDEDSDKTNWHRSKQDVANPVVFFDLKIEGASKTSAPQRMVIELFAHKAPRTAENFRRLCTGEFQYQGAPVGYKGAPFHRIVEGLTAMGGDCLNKDGTGSLSIYGTFFDDENFSVLHDGRGVLSMVTAGADRNGCQFMILAKAVPDLDGKSVAFGRVLEDETSQRTFTSLLSCGSGTGQVTKPCSVVECGEM